MAGRTSGVSDRAVPRCSWRMPCMAVPIPALAFSGLALEAVEALPTEGIATA